MITARKPQRILLPALGLSLAGLAALCPNRCCADELAGPSAIGFQQTHTAPLLSKRHLAIAAIGGTASWVAYELEDTHSPANAIHDAPGELGGDMGNQYGRAGILALGTAGLWTAGRVAGNANVTGAARDMATGLLIDGALVFALKTSVDRTRPNGEHWSFPSGHAASAFTVAPILQSRFGWKVGVPAYALAVATGLGRIEDRWHYPSDVIAGATLGLIVGESVTRHSAVHLPDNLYVGSMGVGLQFGF